MTEKLRNFKAFFLFSCGFFILDIFLRLLWLAQFFCELHCSNWNRTFLALCFLVLLKNSFSFSSSFVQIVFECRFYPSLKILWNLWSFMVHNSCSSCLIINMGSFQLPVVSGFLPALFFLRSDHIFSWFLKSNWSGDFCHSKAGSGAKKRVVLRRKIFCSKFKVEWVK